MRKVLISLSLVLCGASCLFAHGSESAVDLHLAHLVFQIVIILIVGKIGGDIAAFFRLSRPLGQLFCGILISPHFLGGINIPFFKSVLFPVNELSREIPVSNEIYLFSSLAFMILLFMAGLETNISLFLRYLLKGSVIGFIEVLVAFLGTLNFAAWYFGVPCMDPLPLFIASFVAPTSVTIMVEVLFRSRKLGSPEGVIIITSAVLDDILSIVLLSVVMGLVTLSGEGSSVTYLSVSWVVVRALLILISFGALSLLLSKQVVKILKAICAYDNSYISVLALIIAMVASVLMQLAGLSFIVGAYITGLAFSNTDIKFMLRDKLHMIESLFIPIFFVVMGMFVDVHVLLNRETLLMGLIFSFVSIGVKLLGNGIPAYFMGFNLLGATRIGFGMVCRGELTLIIASTALGLNFITPQVFAVAVAVTCLPSLFTAPVIMRLFGSNAQGTKKSQALNDKVLFYHFPSEELAKLVCWELQNEYEEEGYYVYQSKTAGKSLFQVRKDSTFFTFSREHNSLTFTVTENDTLIISTFLYEVLLKLTNDVGKVKDLFNHGDLALVSQGRPSMTNYAFRKTVKLFRKDRIVFLESTQKYDALKELVAALPVTINHEEAYQGVMRREKQYTTGMPGGLALPHTKVKGCEKMEVVFGISQKGVNFEAMDSEPSHLLVLIISAKDGLSSHLEVMAQISNLLNPAKPVYQSLIRMSEAGEVLNYLRNLKNEEVNMNKSSLKSNVLDLESKA